MRLIDAEELDRLFTVAQDEDDISLDEYDWISKMVDRVPTVDAEPVKRGHWIHHRDWEVDGECPVECSECGMGEDYEMNYCSRCGAKMERSRA